MVTCRSGDAEETVLFGESFSRYLQADDVILLSGDLGAGKTQFAKGVASGLGVDDEVTSPTFNILVEYVGDELPLLHFDLYRLNDVDDLSDIDFFGVLESGGVSLVEWGDKFSDAMPSEHLDISITVCDDGTRQFTACGVGPRGEKLEEAFGLACPSKD